MKIVMRANNGDDGDIVCTNADGTGEFAVTVTAKDDVFPEWQTIP
jgi:hypothetical protein